MASARKYELKERARRQDETRRRIVEAVVALHGEVGPARTTVVEIAERAGVSRPTVYSHFPDELSLMTACSRHWLAANPLPDQARWARIPDPRERLRSALTELYEYYARREGMLANVTRDAALMPSIATAAERNFGRYFERAAELLASGRGSDEDGRRRVLAAVNLALDFRTWQMLARGGGLDMEAAAELMAVLVEAAADARPGREARPSVRTGTPVSHRT